MLTRFNQRVLLATGLENIPVIFWTRNLTDFCPYPENLYEEIFKITDKYLWWRKFQDLIALSLQYNIVAHNTV